VILRRTGVLMAAAATALTLASCGSRTAILPKLTVAVDMPATPPGWLPVAYGEAQLSVPRNWVVGLYECDPMPNGGTVWLDNPPASTPACPSENKSSEVFILSGSASHPSRGSSVNGITVYWTSADAYVVPSLEVEISAKGPLARRVLRTLSRSPEAVVLASGPPPMVPPSWHRVSYGGLSLAVPSDWPETNETRWSSGGCSLATPPEYEDAVLFVSGTSMTGAERCPALQEPSVSEVQPGDGVVVDPGPYGPLRVNSDFGKCLFINGLPACPSATNHLGVLVLSVRVPGGPVPQGVELHRVVVEIGLAGNGMVARTILDSMRTA
jgi:hypothetical protein